MPSFIATCPPGYEYLIVDELKSLGVEHAKEGLTQVLFECDWPELYRFCMWTRLTNRVLYPIHEFIAENEDELYEQTKSVMWELHFSSERTFAVDFVSRRSKLNHQMYGALKVKDAIADYFRQEFGERPSVDSEQPDVRIQCRINKNQAQLCIDLSGTGLHQRGYRIEAGEAPIKENFAAAMLYRAQWPSLWQHNYKLCDPMCGAGTLVIEGVMMALNIAPGLNRSYWGFSGWKPFHQTLWKEVVDEANEKLANVKEELSTQEFRFIASDKDQKVLQLAKNNAERAGVEHLIEWHVSDFSELNIATESLSTLFICNPPYGERLDEKKSVQKLYDQLGEWLKLRPVNDKAAILASDKDHGHALKIRAEKRYKFKNGPLDCELLILDLDPKHFVQPRPEFSLENWKDHVSPQAMMLANRLTKNQAALKSFLKQHQVQCYRLYDADLPEYSAAIDVYGEHLHIQEYAPPKTIDANKALRRLKDIEKVAAGVMQIPLERVWTKTRTRQKGDSQYTRQSETQHRIVVDDCGAKSEVNLSDYVDTGLFLDHRKIRQWMPTLCPKGGRLLNLFCYTGMASVHAGLAGCETVSVDLSNTYLRWTERNLLLNKLSLEKHRLIRADCSKWLESEEAHKLKGFDVIFIDPPTFSNSKKMEEHFDVQNEHVKLISDAIGLLNENGKVVFSNNYKRFKMEFKSNEQWIVKEITKETTSSDFKKKPLHRSWLIEKC